MADEHLLTVKLSVVTMVNALRLCPRLLEDNYMFQTFLDKFETEPWMNRVLRRDLTMVRRIVMAYKSNRARWLADAYNLAPHTIAEPMLAEMFNNLITSTLIVEAGDITVALNTRSAFEAYFTSAVSAEIAMMPFLRQQCQARIQRLRPMSHCNRDARRLTTSMINAISMAVASTDCAMIDGEMTEIWHAILRGIAGLSELAIRSLMNLNIRVNDVQNADEIMDRSVDDIVRLYSALSEYQARDH